ncbi:MAG TPA: Mur ligase family protein, partial [Terriglobales bacterium]
MPSYTDAVEGLYALGAELHTTAAKPRRKSDLEHMRTLVRALGHPERRFPSVLIAGTNGKGSTSATLASILKTAGYRTGLYTSPHLIRPNERIRIDGEAIGDDDFAEIYGRVQDCVARLMDERALPQAASFFETMTAMGFLYFAERKVDVAVLEVGLGGRLDATNVVEPLISVITDIDLDHQQWLGDTLPEIAREKAGIMRPNGPVVMLPQHPAVSQALGEVAMSLGARAVNATEYLPDMTRREVARHESPVRDSATLAIPPFAQTAREEWGTRKEAE